MTRRGIKVSIEIDPTTADLLLQLSGSPAMGGVEAPADVPTREEQAKQLGAVVAHLVHSAADGVRRPGAWERGWILQAFGEWWAS